MSGSNNRKIPPWALRVNPLLAIFSSSKSFTDPWVGSHRLNRLGLHLFRMQIAGWMHSLRHAQRLQVARWPKLRSLRRDGVLVIENFLPEVAWRALRDECRAHVQGSLQMHAPPQPGGPGFGPKQYFPGGFDRYDGDTLNRFLNIEAGRTAEAFRVVRDPRLLALCSAAQTRPVMPEKFALYYTRNGADAFPDIQKDLHRDTFHHAIKCWLYLDAVDESQGPFVYAPGSHRITPARASWERARSIAATAPQASSRSSSFRASATEIAEMGYAAPRSYPVKANTLIMADTLGFHARGAAEAGSERLALYGAFRPWPFNPWAL